MGAIKSVYTLSVLDALSSASDKSEASSLLEKVVNESSALYSIEALEKIVAFGHGYLGITIEKASEYRWAATTYYSQNHEASEDELVIQLTALDISSGREIYQHKIRIWIEHHLTRDNEAIVDIDGARYYALRTGDRDRKHIDGNYCIGFNSSHMDLSRDVAIHFYDTKDFRRNGWFTGVSAILEEIIIDGTTIKID